MNPNLSDLLSEARRLDHGGQKDMALAAYAQYLETETHDAGAWSAYGGLLVDAGRWEEACRACEQSLQLDKNNYSGLVHSACAMVHQGLLAEAEGRLRHAITIQPAHLGARLILSDCLIQKGALDQARLLLDEIIEKQPDHLPALNRLNSLYVRQADWPHLRRDMERQLQGFSGPEADYRRSHLSLLFGDMPLGWQQFESRLQVPGRILSQRQFHQPRWRGEAFPGKTLLILWEQGFGDTLMFVRFASKVKALGGRVLLEVQPHLADLVATCPGVDEVIPHGSALPPFDLHVPLLSLPSVFQTELTSIPADIPYLDIPESVPNREWIREALAPSVGRTRVGLVWAGNPDHQRDSKRSLPPTALSPLSELPWVAWHSFQLGTEELPLLPGIVSLAPFISNFSDTAYALSGMDLIITVDTALAHLAGALGIPTFLLISFIPDWRWLMGRADTPWYPTMQIFRQPSPGDWGAVVQQILTSL